MRQPHGGEDLVQLGVDGVVDQPVEALSKDGPESQTKLEGCLRHPEDCGKDIHDAVVYTFFPECRPETIYLI